MEIPILIGLGLLLTLVAFQIIRNHLLGGKVNELDEKVSILGGALTVMQGEMQGVSGRVMGDGMETRKVIHDELLSIRSTVEQSRTVMEGQMDSLHRFYANLTQHLGKLDETTTRVEEMGRDVLTLRDILAKPKGLGLIGELMMEKELLDILPQDHFHMQHKLAEGLIADAVVFFPNGSVAIDAKFPLNNYRNYQNAVDDQEKSTYRQEFLRDVRTRIDETSRYIVPTAGTLNFAIMYIPS